MTQALEDRTDRLFARSGDVAYLLDRARVTGLTAIVAGPQMGKSWTLNEVGRQLAANPGDPFLVGFAEAVVSTPDLLLRAVSDLYQRWLENATYRQQFLQVWEQQKNKLLPGVAGAIGKIAGDLPGVGKLVGGVVEQALGGLLAANADLESGGLTLPPLQYEQARDLVCGVAEISGRKVALCLDAWEHSADPEAAAEPLHAFAVKADGWPHCHVFLTTRADPAALKPLQEITAAVSGVAEFYFLSNLEPDAGETARMTEFLKQHVAATRQVDAATLVRLIDGCPGVIGRWTSKGQRGTMQTEADLARVAADAQAYRFSDLEAELEKLEGDKRLLALRLAVLPITTGRDAWNALRTAVLDKGSGKALDEVLLDDLLESDVLEATDPPTFGHAKRRESAVDWFNARRPTLLRQQTGVLARMLGARIESVENVPTTTIIAATSLRELAAVTATGDSDPWPAALCVAAATLFGTPVPTAALHVSDWIDRADADIAGARLVAMGLVNAVFFATQANDRSEGEVLLDTLRKLAARLPEDAAIQTQLGNGLGHQYDMARLQVLAHHNPDNAAIRTALAKKLFNALDKARESRVLPEVNDTLAELRALAAAYPTDATACLWFCRGAYNALRYADEAGDPERAATLLHELSGQVKAFPDDPEVAECLARGIYQLVVVSKLQPTDAERANAQLLLYAAATKFPANELITKIYAATRGATTS